MVKISTCFNGCYIWVALVANYCWLLFHYRTFIVLKKVILLTQILIWIHVQEAYGVQCSPSGQCLPAHPLSPELLMWEGRRGRLRLGGALYPLYFNVWCQELAVHHLRTAWECGVFWEMFLLFPSIFNKLYNILIALEVDDSANRMSCIFLEIYCQPWNFFPVKMMRGCVWPEERRGWDAVIMCGCRYYIA